VVVEQCVDHFPAIADDLVCFFVPHEYHPLVKETAHPTAAQLRRSVALCTEQPGSPWFDVSVDIAKSAGAVIDINELGTTEMSQRGIAVEYAPLGYVPTWDSWHGKDGGARQLDFAFLGAFTKRRAQALARCAEALQGHRSAIHLVETAQPHTADSPTFLSHERKWKLLADTNVLLNVHQARQPYMEWHRIIGAAINGCVVVSEISVGTEPFIPGEHFISASYNDIPGVLSAALDDPNMIHRIRHEAYELLRERMPMSGTIEVLLRAVERAATNPAPHMRQLAAVAMPEPPPARKPGWKVEGDSIGELQPVRTALKHLVVQSRKLERQIRDLQTDQLPADAVIVERFGPEAPRPRVSVLLTIYNYADYVPHALRSVALSEPMDVEVVAVDDASTDESVNTVRASCEELPWLPVRLVRRLHNGGLSAARNLAAAHARSDLLFILDADNVVFPSGIRLLADALRANSDAAFAYGLIETFDTNGPSGLVSWLDWDSERLRYGNYIDAMSMIRRSALEQIGGYSTDTALSMGWEDFAVWVAMADQGFNGVRVPDFIGRYRVNPHSMLSLTDIDNSAVWASLLRKYPSLAATPRQAASPPLR